MTETKFKAGMVVFHKTSGKRYTLVDVRPNTQYPLVIKGLERCGGFAAENYEPVKEETPMEKKFDPTKLSTERAFDATRPVQTRDGRKARIICTDYKSRGPLLTLISDREGSEMPVCCMADGQNACGNSSYDLVNVPEKRWVNLYERRAGDYFTSEEAAKRCIPTNPPHSYGKYIKTVEIELE